MIARVQPLNRSSVVMIDACPGPVELTDLVAGRLTTCRHDAVEQHVAGCAECLEQLEQCAEPVDPLVETLAHFRVPPTTDDPHFHAAVARLKSGQAAAPRRTVDPLLSTTLGDFRIIRQIGRGGMGIVYEAEQLSLARRVALKVLPAAALADAHQLARFENEARAAALLKHAHIVDVYAVGVAGGVHYYAMRLIDGRNLGQLIAELRENVPVAHCAPVAFPERATFAAFSAIADLGIQAADALHYAHEQGIVHRDVKPSNLLVDDQRQLWVADFGVARIAAEQSLTPTGNVVGTWRYLSPEQASGRRAAIDHRTDIYGLGATLYELATLQPLYTGEPTEVLLKIVSGRPRPPRTLDPRIPADLETIIMKAISKDPADRYTTASELAADLRRFVEHRPILAAPPTIVDRGVKWTRRHPRGAAAVAALVAMVTVVAVCLSALLMAQNARLLERPATMRFQLQQKPLTHQPFLVTFDDESFAEGITYDGGLFSVPVAGVYVVSASAYIENTSKRRIEIRVYGKDEDVNLSDHQPRRVFVLQQSIVETENQYNSTVNGTVSVYADAGDRISVWTDAGGSPEARIATTPNSNWVSISLINQVRDPQR